MNKDKIDSALTEWIIEEGWQLQRKFMQEVERELEIQGLLPVNILMASRNVAMKFQEFARKN